MAIHWHLWSRKAHRWGAILIALPFLLVLVTGILLQVKKQVPWVQPPTQRGSAKTPTIAWDALLAVAKSQPEAEITGWQDIERIDVQPARGIAKIQAKNRWEIQIDTASGAILHTAYRRSDLIESLHDGSFFDDRAKVWVFLPVALVVLGLWGTGLYLFILPYYVKWKRRRRPA
jgi:uncharacterized iron-regulated membrane protein